MTDAPRPQLELISPSLRRPEISHVIFDFDGTLSWLRHGWPTLMREVLLRHAPAEWRENERRRTTMLADILSLNGKPSIFQMHQFCEKLQREQSPAPNAEMLLGEYLEELAVEVRARMSAVRRGEAAPDAFVVHGARRLIETLRAQGRVLIILSGTVEEDVRAEAQLLGLAQYFGSHIYGSPAHGRFSKKDVIDRLLREERIDGRHVLAFGDGPVEIEFTKAVDGLAIGVASDEEENGSHRTDPDKRAQLVRAGADAIIPDYSQADVIRREVFGA